MNCVKMGSNLTYINFKHLYCMNGLVITTVPDLNSFLSLLSLIDLKNRNKKLIPIT